MSNDLAAWLRSQVDDDETLAESDYDIMISARKVRDAAAEIARLRATISQIMTPDDNYKRLNAALATARREGMEEAAKMAERCAADWAKSAIGMVAYSKWDFQSRSEAGEDIAAAIRAAAKEDREP